MALANYRWTALFYYCSDTYAYGYECPLDIADLIPFQKPSVSRFTFFNLLFAISLELTLNPILVQ